MVTTSRALSTVILAAGRGARMCSTFPKALHTLAGKAMVQYVIDAVAQLSAEKIYFVYGYGGDLLREYLAFYRSSFNWILQEKQKGTGHAVQHALTNLHGKEDILIVYCDVPLISPSTLQRLLDARPEHGIALLTANLDNPDGYGRILRNNGEVVGIVEQIETNEEQRKIKEINTGILVAGSIDLKRWLGKLNNQNTQEEYYLTDIIPMVWREGGTINTVQPKRHSEVRGVNNRLQLATLERLFQREQAERLLLAGIMLSDPDRFDLRGHLQHGRDVSIDANVLLEGRVTLGNRVVIGTGCILKNAIIGDDVVISPYTVIKDSQVAARSTVGPFAHLRPGSKLEEDAHVGNFVEMKRACLGKGSKAGHLSYLGDAKIGEKANIGAGTITCNYDGVNKHNTVIDDEVFVGSGSQLVAPLTVGRGAFIGAGTTVTNDISSGETIISRVRQFSISSRVRTAKK